MATPQIVRLSGPNRGPETSWGPGGSHLGPMESLSPVVGPILTVPGDASPRVISERAAVPKTRSLAVQAGEAGYGRPLAHTREKSFQPQQCFRR